MGIGVLGKTQQLLRKALWPNSGQGGARQGESEAKYGTGSVAGKGARRRGGC